MKQKLIYAVIETIILVVVGLLAFTVLNQEYLFGWAAHNWSFYLVLGIVALLFIFFHRVIVSVCMTAGITLGIFIGNFLGTVIKVYNESKIVERMTGEEVYRLQHHPGFEIWMGTILVSLVIGFTIHTISAKKHR
jgi:hypothetical protein